MNFKEDLNHKVWTFLLVVGSVFSMVVSSAFTTPGAWAANQPPTNQKGNPCLAFPVNSPSYNKCMGIGTNQNGGTKLNLKKVTLNQSNNKNRTNSNSTNHNTVNSQVKIIGKVPTMNTKVTPQLTVNNPKDPSLKTNGPTKLLVTNKKDPSLNTNTSTRLSVTTSKNPVVNPNGSSKLSVTNQKDPSLNTNASTRLSDTNPKVLSFGKNQTRDVSVIRSFEEVTGHHFSSEEIKNLENSSSVNSEDETQFIQRLENTTKRELNDKELKEVSDVNSDENNEENVESSADIDFPITVISGVVSSLDESNIMDTFLIGNTTIQLNPDLVGNFTIQNGEDIKLDGYFNSTENFVVTQIVNVIQ